MQTIKTPVRHLTFEYDYMGRRIRKTVKDANQTVLTDEKFCYDGWNLLAMLNGTNGNRINSFLWGLDLSGSQQGAAGVGGLLALSSTTAGNHFVCYDGNGNVMKLISASTVTATANYEYSPFGDVVLASGTAATANPFRFSTKYQDDETGTFYYGYRHYASATGRWLSRDPVGHRGGKNLYGFLGNLPVNTFDILGHNPPPNGRDFKFHFSDYVWVYLNVSASAPNICGEGIIEVQLDFKIYENQNWPPGNYNPIYIHDDQVGGGSLTSIPGLESDDGQYPVGYALHIVYKNEVGKCHIGFASGSIVANIFAKGLDSPGLAESIQIDYSYMCKPCCEVEIPFTYSVANIVWDADLPQIQL